MEQAEITPAVEAHFNQALSGVESKSIREWASSERNRPIFLQIVANALAKNPKSEVERLTIFIVSEAIGL